MTNDVRVFDLSLEICRTVGQSYCRTIPGGLPNCQILDRRKLLNSRMFSHSLQYRRITRLANKQMRLR